MKIAFFEIKKHEEDYIKSKLKNHTLIFNETHLNNLNIEKVKDFDIICLFINSKIDSEILNKLKNIKAIVTMSTGYDHINVEECKKRNIKVYNVPFYGE